MPLAADHSDLPRAQADPEPEGLTPDPEPRFIGVLAEAWAAERDDDKPTAAGTRFRHSDAGKCARAISYTAAGIPRSDPMDLTGVWNTKLGTLIHDAWQEALVARWPDARAEVTVKPADVDASGHVDAVIHLEDRTVVYELKTIGGYGFKAAVGKARKGTPAEGPKSTHLLQAAINGLAHDADEVVVGYLSKECISKNYAMPSDLDRFGAEWTFGPDQFRPLAEKELERVSGILDLLDEGELAARKIPELPPGSEIVDATKRRWEQTSEGKILDTGTWWECGYCAYQTLCAQVGPGRVPVETAVQLSKGGEAA